MKIIFEDSNNAPSSVLLRNCFLGDSIIFSEGCHNIPEYIEGYIESDDIVTFVDLVPDNMSTINFYNDLVSEYRDFIERNKLMICPILCIEYVILKMLLTYGYLNDATVIDAVALDFNSSSIKDLVARDKKASKTMEKLMKSILVDISSKSGKRCLRNSFKYSNINGVMTRRMDSRFGIFYESDCLCDMHRCAIDVRNALKIKAEELYVSLPVFITGGSEHENFIKSIGVNFEDNSIEEASSIFKDFYDLLCDKNGLNRVVF